MDKQRIYTGIGSRSTPSDHLRLIKKIGYYLAGKGYLLRSGGAAGADEAFELGVVEWLDSNTADKPVREIWIPWKGFRVREHPSIGDCKMMTVSQVETATNILVDTGVYSRLRSRKAAVRLLFTRNVFQIRGDGNTLSELVIYYSKLDRYGAVCGGTRIAVNLAKTYNIDTYNLFLDDDRDLLSKRIGMCCDLEAW